MTAQELYLAAVHEAGHAVIARELGIGIRTMTVVKSEDALAHTLYTGRPPSAEQLYYPDSRTRARLEKYIIATWAGTLAEERATGERNDAGAGIHAMYEHPEHGTIALFEGDMRSIVEMSEAIHGGGGPTSERTWNT